jgi:hypothetical protein
MRSVTENSSASNRASGTAALPLLLVAALGCSSEPSRDGPEPFVLPEGAERSAAPFRGPVREREEQSDEPRPEAPDHTPGPSPAVAEIATPAQSTLRTGTDRRREAWLGESFRCKAISSTRLRRCRFEHTDQGFRLRFPMSDVTCENVTFDERGDPERLTGCRGAWLRVPATNRLRPDRAREVWSGSHTGWRWKSDRQPYCCPGLWLEAPDSIRNL